MGRLPGEGGSNGHLETHAAYWSELSIKLQLTVSVGNKRSDLGSRRKALQGFRFSKSLVDLGPVLHFLFVGEEIQSAFSTAMDPFFLE